MVSSVSLSSSPRIEGSASSSNVQSAQSKTSEKSWLETAREIGSLFLSKIRSLLSCLSCLCPCLGSRQIEKKNEAKGHSEIEFLRLKDKREQVVQGSLAAHAGSHTVILQHNELQNFKSGDQIEIILKQPIFMFPNAQFGRMKCPHKCLVMDENDFKELQKIIHSGAFGNDFVTENGRTYVWKIPADILYISDYVVDEFPNPVGEYELTDDFCNSQGSSPHIGSKFQKQRFDRKIGEKVVSVHQLVDFSREGEDSNPRCFPAITTGSYFYKNFYEPTTQRLSLN